MILHKPFFAGLFFSLLMASPIIADEFAPLRPEILRALSYRGINREGVQFTASEQEELIRMLGMSSFLPRSVVMNYIRDRKREKNVAENSGPTLRQITNRDDEPHELSARQERRLVRALARPGVPEVDHNSLTYEEKRLLLAAIPSMDFDFIRAVRSVLANK